MRYRPYARVTSDIPPVIAKRYTPEQHIARLENALRGISTCATRCGCCEMHKRIADNVLQDPTFYHQEI